MTPRQINIVSALAIIILGAFAEYQWTLVGPLWGITVHGRNMVDPNWHAQPDVFWGRLRAIVGAVLIIFSWARRRVLAQWATDALWRFSGKNPAVMGRFSTPLLPKSQTVAGERPADPLRAISTLFALVLIVTALFDWDFLVFALVVTAAGRTAIEGRTMRREADIANAKATATVERAATESAAQRVAEQRPADQFRVFLARGAGVALERGHAAGIANGAEVVLTTRDLAEHTMIQGRSGGGKTMAAILPIAKQLFETREAGSFVISAKRNFSRQIGYLADTHGHETAVIGPEHLPYAIGRGVKPAAWGNIVEQAFHLGGGKTDAFFAPNSILRVRHAAGVLCGLSGDTTPREIRDYIFAPLEEREQVQEQAESLALTFAATGDRHERERADWIMDALDFERGAWREIEAAEKTRAGVLGQINTVFDSLATRALDRAFGRVENGAELSDMLAGKVIVLDIDRDAHGRYAASIVALCMFEQFSRFMSARLEFPASDPRRRIPVSFIVDEYADCISPQHTEFFRKARESMVCGVVALQGDDVMLQALKGDRATMGALLSLFSQKITLPVNDQITIDRISKWFSKTEQTKYSSSFVEGESDSWGSSAQHAKIGGGGSNRGGGTSKSFTESVSTQMEEIITAQQFAQLERRMCADDRGGQRPEWFQAIYTGFINGARRDDVVWLYVDNEIFHVSQM